jgi:anti-sigma B factor antagonist
MRSVPSHATDASRRAASTLLWEVFTRQDAVIVVIRNPGLGALLAPELGELLSRCARPGVARLLLDLRSVEFMDATALSALVYAFRTMDAELALVAPRERVRRLLRMTELDRLFDVYTDVSGALGRDQEAPAETLAPGRGLPDD